MFHGIISFCYGQVVAAPLVLIVIWEKFPVPVQDITLFIAVSGCGKSPPTVTATGITL
jgi:hypothetical protein